MHAIWLTFLDWVYAHEDWAAGILTVIILGAALFATLRTIRAMRHSQTTTIAMNLRRDYESGMVFEGRKIAYYIDGILAKRGTQNKSLDFALTVEHYKAHYPDEFAKLASIPALFDMMGWLVRNKCCKATDVDEQIAWEQPYSLWKEYIRRIQEKGINEPLDENPTAMYGNFVWLVNQLQKN